MSSVETRKATMKPTINPISFRKTLSATLLLLVALFAIVSMGGADRASAAPQSGKFQFSGIWAGNPSGLMATPSDVAVAGNGDVYVLDTANNRVQVFDQAGVFKFTFGTYGSGNQQMKAPLGIRIYSNTVWVADSGNNRVLKLNLAGGYLAQFGTGGSGNGQFNQPRDVSVNNGRIYVADSGNNRIQVFDATTLTYMLQFGTGGSGNGQLATPFGVDVVSEYDNAICSGGGYRYKAYVADTLNDRVEVFTATCAALSYTYSSQFSTPTRPYKAKLKDPTNYASNIYVARTLNNQVTEYTPAGVQGSSWGSTGGGDGQFRQPNGLGISQSNGKVFVADSVNNRVQRFSSTGTYETKWGISQNGIGEFNNPSDVATDSAGNIYAVDRNNDRIEKFNSSGRYLFSFGSTGTGDGQLNAPYGIGISSADQIYIADRGNNRIQIFDTSGNYVTKWGTTGSGNGQFSAPTDVTIIGTQAYVVDSGNSRIQAFSAPGVYNIQWGTAGSGNSQFTVPTYITSGGGYVYVTDSGRVQKFLFTGAFTASLPIPNASGVSWKNDVLTVTDSAAGQIIMYSALAASATINHKFTACSSGSRPGQFSNPNGVDLIGTPTYDSGADEFDAQMFVADSGNNRIQKTRIFGSACQAYGVLGNSEFGNPTKTAQTSTGQIYVADTDNNRVIKYSSTGSAVDRWGLALGTDGFSQTVRGLDVASDDSLFAVDGNQIRHFSSSGAVTGSVAIGSQQDLAVGASDQVYVTNGSSTITRYNSSLVSQGTWGSAGAGNGQFSGATGLDVAPSGDVYVADNGNNRIQRFTSTGTYVSQFSTPAPWDVFVANDGRVYVVSSSGAAVRVYQNSSGTLTEQWGTSGIGNSQFTTPRGIMVTPSNKVFVSDSGNNRLQLFDWLPTRTQYSDQATDYAGNQVSVPSVDSTTVEGGF